MSDINRYVTSGSTNSFSALTAVNTTPAAGKKHIIGSWIIANTSNNAVSVDATIQVSGVDYYQVKGFTLQAGDSLFLHGLLGRVVLLAGDLLRVKCSVANAIDVTVAIAEEP